MPLNECSDLRKCENRSYICRGKCKGYIHVQRMATDLQKIPAEMVNVFDHKAPCHSDVVDVHVAFVVGGNNSWNNCASACLEWSPGIQNKALDPGPRDSLGFKLDLDSKQVLSRAYLWFSEPPELMYVIVTERWRTLGDTNHVNIDALRKAYFSSLTALFLVRHSRALAVSWIN